MIKTIYILLLIIGLVLFFLNFYFIFKNRDFYKKKNRRHNDKSHFLVNIVAIGGGIVLMLILIFGLEKYLSLIIPANWGGLDEDGIWRKDTYTFAITLAPVVTIMILALVSEYYKLKDRVEYLKEEIEEWKQKYFNK